MPDFLADVLSRKENQYWTLCCKTAKSWGDQPLDHLAPGLRPDFDPVRRAQLNQKLKMAFQMLEDDVCSGCGVPVWLGHSTLGQIEFRVHRTTCYSCQALDEAKPPKAEPGSSEWVEVVIEDGPWPTRKQGFDTYEDVAGRTFSEAEMDADED
jgi:hypothetical protein